MFLPFRCSGKPSKTVCSKWFNLEKDKCVDISHPNEDISPTLTLFHPFARSAFQYALLRFYLIVAGFFILRIADCPNNYLTLTNKGYHYEHNFGHGTQHLAAFLLTLNLLAFLFHTVLDLVDAKYKLLRTELRVRKTFFDDLRALTRYLYFESWEHLMDFMIANLKLTPPVDSS